MSEIYLGNPNLKKANTQIQFSANQIEEFMRCKNDPIYFTQKYVKIVSLDEGLVPFKPCLLYTSDAADDTPCVDLGGRRIIKNSIMKQIRYHSR